VAQQEPERPGISPQARGCIEATSDCYKVCAETLSHSLGGGALWQADHLRALIDCSEVLQATENALLRGSTLSVMLSTVCAEACEKVAVGCRRLTEAVQNDQLTACAEACEETAEACRLVAV
jgi:hypothetical protein